MYGPSARNGCKVRRVLALIALSVFADTTIHSKIYTTFTVSPGRRHRFLSLLPGLPGDFWPSVICDEPCEPYFVSIAAFFSIHQAISVIFVFLRQCPQLLERRCRPYISREHACSPFPLNSPSFSPIEQVSLVATYSNSAMSLHHQAYPTMSYYYPQAHVSKRLRFGNLQAHDSFG